MAPTIYLSELPAVRRTTVPCSHRRQRIINGAIGKHQRLEIRRLETSNAPLRNEVSLTPPESPVWEPECPNDSYAPTIVSSSSPKSARIPTEVKEHWRAFLAKRKGLLSIAIRTMALVRRNNILQERVNALREETRDFIHSVLNNPENKCIQQKLDCGDDEEDVSSSTEKSLSPSSALSYSTNSPSNDITSTSDNSENDTDRSFEDDEES
ncbi:uncharacterized protein LOC108623088 [Ceratina calcarata]|uniref:Uncharacterized protein LOC108623088 n=1 Tax=Ceratina calcarata TaxID=156304 RepID=A0AAJ7ITU3_9HYME|nr:uncharacterized protein LOC108623088 [Ceratina calcarata]XP_026667716.1 uncharacterized protein LOC108623088 [Ceratina calcarata]